MLSPTEPTGDASYSPLASPADPTGDASYSPLASPTEPTGDASFFYPCHHSKIINFKAEILETGTRK